MLGSNGLRALVACAVLVSFVLLTEREQGRRWAKRLTGLALCTLVAADLLGRARMHLGLVALLLSGSVWLWLSSFVPEEPERAVPPALMELCLDCGRTSCNEHAPTVGSAWGSASSSGLKVLRDWLVTLFAFAGVRLCWEIVLLLPKSAAESVTVVFVGRAIISVLGLLMLAGGAAAAWAAWIRTGAWGLRMSGRRELWRYKTPVANAEIALSYGQRSSGWSLSLSWHDLSALPPLKGVSGLQTCALSEPQQENFCRLCADWAMIGVLAIHFGLQRTMMFDRAGAVQVTALVAKTVTVTIAEDFERKLQQRGGLATELARKMATCLDSAHALDLPGLFAKLQQQPDALFSLQELVTPPPGPIDDAQMSVLRIGFGPVTQ